MKWVIITTTPERGATVAMQAGIAVEDALVITSLEGTVGLTMAHGDTVLIDGTRAFWSTRDWPYILQNVRSANAAAGQDWVPRFV